MDWATLSTIIGAILTTFTLNRLFAWRRADQINRKAESLRTSVRSSMWLSQYHEPLDRVPNESYFPG